MEQELRDKEQVANQNINICFTDYHYIFLNIHSKYSAVVTLSYRNLEFSWLSQPKRFLYMCMVATEISENLGHFKFLNSCRLER